MSLRASPPISLEGTSNTNTNDSILLFSTYKKLALSIIRYI